MAKPDMALISDLYDAIEQDPSANDTRILLMQQCINAGWLDLARDIAQQVQQYDPSNPEAQRVPAKPDMNLISDLYDTIEQDPSAATEARVLLMQQYINAGWLDAARDIAQQVHQYDPSNSEARRVLHAKSTRSSSNRYNKRSQIRPPPQTSIERDALETQFSKTHEAIRTRAGVLLQEIQLINTLQEKPFPNQDESIQNLRNLAEGQISCIVSMSSPRSVRGLARALESDELKALDLLIDDLKYVISWLRSSPTPAISNDAIRERLAKRCSLVAVALPDSLQNLPQVALMHIEHEELGRTYINSETMYGDDVIDIRRDNFWVSEDGYCWDMEELSACLAVNGGVMRNPLSKQMFTPDDIRSIIAHPLGNRLGAIQLEQAKLCNGVRLDTIDRLDKLSGVLLADQSLDQVTSRLALEDFLQYIATLPRAEQQAIDDLRVPAVDTHTGQPFDCSIGQAVRDAMANKICLHKTGDMIGQVGKYLRHLHNSRSN